MYKFRIHKIMPLFFPEVQLQIYEFVKKKNNLELKSPLYSCSFYPK